MAEPPTVFNSVTTLKIDEERQSHQAKQNPYPYGTEHARQKVAYYTFLWLTKWCPITVKCSKQNTDQNQRQSACAWTGTIMLLSGLSYNTKELWEWLHFSWSDDITLPECAKLTDTFSREETRCIIVSVHKRNTEIKWRQSFFLCASE